MLIERKHTADLIPADYNPRKDLKPGDPEYDKLKRSMEQFGYVEPVIWNKATGRVVGGHQRLKVLMDMGVTEVECVVVEMDEEREKALNIALNKISGDWDKEKLMLLISDLQGADFDVSLTGFDPAEIDDLFKDSLKDGVKDDEFDVDAEMENPAITKTGDVWTLGRHRLVCGDSTKPETFALLMEGLKANLEMCIRDRHQGRGRLRGRSAPGGPAQKRHGALPLHAHPGHGLWRAGNLGRDRPAPRLSVLRLLHP